MLKNILTPITTLLIIFSCNTVKQNYSTLSKSEFLVIHTKNENDGQTITLRNNHNKIYTTTISIPNRNWVELKKGNIISMEIKDSIEMNPTLLNSKNIKIISKKYLKENIISSISTTKTSYNLGEVIELEMDTKNFGEEKFTFLPWKTPIENSFTGEFMDIIYDSKKIEYSGIMVKRMPPTKNDYITLKPNESISGKINLLDGYKFNKKGIYSIQFNGVNDKLPASNLILIEIK
ncbi:hypothetical protein SAMN05216503_1465 [Polaribacter sp. KT25b]|nr:hypothetical protein SAMN05216503_1465 [Polaribacter sp. KT25b]